MKNLFIASFIALVFLSAFGAVPSRAVAASVAPAPYDPGSCRNSSTSSPLPAGVGCTLNSVQGKCDGAGTCVSTAGATAEPSCAYTGSAGNQCVGNNGAGYCDAAGICQKSSAAPGTVSAATNAANPLAAKTPTAYKPSDGDQYGFVMQKIMSLFAWLVGVAALTLDYSVYYTVVTMGGFVSHLTAVGTTWRILRDIGNIMLIFGFLAIGITTILNVDWYGGGKKMLPMLLVAAVFLNFSLFFAEAVIDAGNLFATQFYTQINGGNPPGMKSFDPGASMRLQNEGISNKIMSQLGLQTLYGGVRTNPDVLKGANSWLIGFMGILLFITTAFVLFSLSFVLIARFVALIFLIILSPIGFAGLAVPQLKRRADQWWSTLFQQTITAPILLLMLYIALAVITDSQFLTGMCGSGTCTKNWLGFVSGNDFTGFGSMVLSFIVAMGLLIAVVIQSKNLSAFGASWATKAAGKLTFGATALGMRSTIGLGSQAASKAVRSSRLGATKFGRVAATTFDKGAKASFDIRGTGVLKNLPIGGVDAGAAQEGGYRARVEEVNKKHQEYLKSVGEAIEEKHLPSVAAAMQKRSAAETVSTTAQDEKIAAQKQLKPLTDEVARLEKIVSDNHAKGLSSPEARIAVEDLARAREKVPPVVSAVQEADNKVKAAQTPLIKALKEEKEATELLSAEKKKAALAYAENIRGLTSWAMYGPGGGKAANKIVKDTLKKEDKLDAIKKLLKEEKKPEAPAPAPAPKPEAPKS